ncbi:MAG: CDGSH iron-sulfur domain-containing protein [Bacteroidales bacterium]
MSEKEKPVIAGLRSIKIEMQPGIYAWCACGRSKNQPFCDGSHATTNFKPLLVNITEARLVKWCSCKMTKTAPYCDHSHRELPGYEQK